ncbi:MAG: ABC transporter permease [Anaerolineales bacterium]|jgi:ABC-type dipeptide/oligopeptide/nickel transport system permease subunit|nr:ABC transporter permease [Anaerolineales bacterium]
MADGLNDPTTVVDFAVREHRSLWIDAWRRLISNRTARLGMAIVVIFVATAVLAHFFWDYDAKTDLEYTLRLKPPNLVASEEIPTIHIFGTDKLGRDIFRRVVHGGWNSLRVGLVAVGISLIAGGLLGLVAGFYESINLAKWERITLQSISGLALAILPAWIAQQWIILILFTLLGILAILLNKPEKNSIKRRFLFSLAGLVAGGAPALLVSPYTALVTGLLGLAIGYLIALPLGGRTLSNTIMRVMDITLAFPSYLLAIAIVAFLGPGLEKGMIAIGIVGIPIYARLVRSSVLSIAQKEYILAAESVGEGHGRMIFRHILPNVLSPITVQTTLGLGSAILSAAALGFLGLGAIPPEPEWGAMLGDSYRYLTSGSWWAVLFPGLAIMFSVLGFNLLGDGLRDALDPKLKT